MTSGISYIITATTAAGMNRRHMLESIDGLDIVAPCACPGGYMELKAEDSASLSTGRWRFTEARVESCWDIGEDFEGNFGQAAGTVRLHLYAEREDEYRLQRR